MYVTIASEERKHGVNNLIQSSRVKTENNAAVEDTAPLTTMLTMFRFVSHIRLVLREKSSAF